MWEPSDYDHSSISFDLEQEVSVYVEKDYVALEKEPLSLVDVTWEEGQGLCLFLQDKIPRNTQKQDNLRIDEALLSQS